MHVFKKEDLKVSEMLHYDLDVSWAVNFPPFLFFSPISPPQDHMYTFYEVLNNLTTHTIIFNSLQMGNQSAV